MRPETPKEGSTLGATATPTALGRLLCVPVARPRPAPRRPATPCRPATPPQTARRRPVSQWEAPRLRPPRLVAAGSDGRAMVHSKIDHLFPAAARPGTPRGTGPCSSRLALGLEKVKAGGPGHPGGLRDPGHSGGLLLSLFSRLADTDNSPSLRPREKLII